MNHPPQILSSAPGPNAPPQPLPPLRSPPVPKNTNTRPLQPQFWIPMLCVGIALAAILYWFNPSQYGFYPRCYLYTSTGFLCPGCGGLRATHQLLNGHLAEAFRLNPLAVLAAPIFAWGWLERLVLPHSRRPLAHLLAHRWAFPILAGILAGYGIARNLPLPESFRWLRP